MAKAAVAEKIPYVWQGKNRSGNLVKGEIFAANEAMAKAEIRRQGNVPLKVRKKPKPLFGGQKKIKPADIAGFARQLATMMAAGIPVVQSMDIVIEGTEHEGLKNLVTKIRSDVEGGTTLADALDKHRQYFDELFVNLVRAGENSGALEIVLDRIATYKEKMESIKGKIKKALFYPTAVIIVGFIVSAILLIFVVPQFESLFQNFGADLPAFTQMVLNLSEFFQAYWWTIFGGIGLAAYSFTFFRKRSDKFNHHLDRLILKAPLFGELAEKSAIARFARTLSTMFSAGVPLVEALDSVAGATGNVIYSDAIKRVKEEAATGQQLHYSIKQTGLFPNMVVQFIAIGEESGNLDEMLAKVADNYEEQVDNMVDAMSSLMEPMIMAFLGVVVGGLVVAMYLPIFKLGAVV